MAMAPLSQGPSFLSMSPCPGSGCPVASSSLLDVAGLLWSNVFLCLPPDGQQSEPLPFYSSAITKVLPPSSRGGGQS